MSQPVSFVLPVEEKFASSNWAEWKELIILVAKSQGVILQFSLQLHHYFTLLCYQLLNFLDSRT
jgi:hypothetical protein